MGGWDEREIEVRHHVHLWWNGDDNQFVELSEIGAEQAIRNIFSWNPPSVPWSIESIDADTAEVRVGDYVVGRIERREV